MVGGRKPGEKAMVVGMAAGWWLGPTSWPAAPAQTACTVHGRRALSFGEAVTQAEAAQVWELLQYDRSPN